MAQNTVTPWSIYCLDVLPSRFIRAYKRRNDAIEYARILAFQTGNKYEICYDLKRLEA